MTKTIQTLTPTECQKLLAYICPVNYPGLMFPRTCRNLTMILLMLDAGLRVGELVQLRVSDLYLQGSPVTTLCVRAEISKTKVERNIPISYRLMNSIVVCEENCWRLPQHCGNGFAFKLCHKRNPITIRQVQRILARASLSAIGRKIHPHILRHTFATRLMAKTNIRVVQQLLGHKSITSTQIYTHPNSTDLREAINAI